MGRRECARWSEMASETATWVQAPGQPGRATGRVAGRWTTPTLCVYSRRDGLASWLVGGQCDAEGNATAAGGQRVRGGQVRGGRRQPARSCGPGLRRSRDEAVGGF